MTQIGLIKWVRTTDNRLDYGVIQLLIQENKEVFFHNSAVVCESNLLDKGVRVRFQIRCNDKKEQAVNIELLKRAGIINWINWNGNQIDYGLAQTATNLNIDREEKLEVFFHHSQIHYDVHDELIMQGKAVTFGYKYNERRKRYEAIDLRLLEKETDRSIIELCIESSNSKLWKPVFNLYLDSFENIEEQIEVSLRKIQSDECEYSQSSFAASLPKKIIEQSAEIRNYLDYEQQIEILIELIEQSQNDKCRFNKHLDELEKVLNKIKKDHNCNGFQKNDLSYFLLKIPDYIKSQKIIIDCLPAENKLPIIVNLIQEGQDRKHNIEHFITKLANIISQFSDRTTIYTFGGLCDSEKVKKTRELPNGLKKHPEIYSVLPVKEKLNIAIEDLSTYKGLVENLVTEIAYRERQFLKIPDWIKNISSINSCLYKIPNAESRDDAPEAEQIKQFIEQRNINNLCHFTTIENLSGICNTGGLLSIEQLRRRGLLHNQIDEGRWDGQLNHICCSIARYNSMYMYHAQQRAAYWVLLFIKPDYLWKENTLFCRINAATNCGRYIEQGLIGLQSMYADKVIDIQERLWTRTNRIDCEPTCIQAEVMVYESISIEDIVQINVNGIPGNEQRVRDAGWQGDVHIDPNLFR